jgi:hypothetical protein
VALGGSSWPKGSVDRSSNGPFMCSSSTARLGLGPRAFTRGCSATGIGVTGEMLGGTRGARAGSGVRPRAPGGSVGSGLDRALYTTALGASTTGATGGGKM